jgi:hypothetical protein
MLSILLPGYSMQEGSVARGDALMAPDHYPLRPTRRLVVLVPDGGLDETALARRVWRLASSSALKVLFLGLSSDPECVAPIRRRLALLAVAVDQGEVSARVSVAVGSDWLQAVEDVLHDGDLLICIAGHRVPYHVIGRRKLGDALASAFRAPVYELGGLQISQSQVSMPWLRTLVAWSISIAILVAFAGLQIWISRNASSRLSPILLCLTIIAEGIILLRTIERIG